MAPSHQDPSIVILTGAGISAESGLDTFRGSATGGGIWAQHRVEDVATPEAFARDPDRVHVFYNRRHAALFTAIGTSGNVYPATQFVHHAAETCELNLEPTGSARDFHQRMYGKASEIVPDWVEHLLREQGMS